MGLSKTSNIAREPHLLCEQAFENRWHQHGNKWEVCYSIIEQRSKLTYLFVVNDEGHIDIFHTRHTQRKVNDGFLAAASHTILWNRPFGRWSGLMRADMSNADSAMDGKAMEMP